MIRFCVLASLLVAPMFGGRVSAEPLYMVTAENVLAQYDTAAPSDLVHSVTISRAFFFDMELVAGIEFVPATGDFYAIGASGRPYSLNPSTGEALTANLGPPAGTHIGFAYDRGEDILRVGGTARRNLAYRPAGDRPFLLREDPAFAYAPTDPGVGISPSLMGAAYASDSQGASRLYLLDSLRDVLVMEDPPYSGILHTIGPLGFDFNETGGFAVSLTTGIAYAALLPSNSLQSSLYEINLATGAATIRGPIGGGLVITGLAIPEPATVTILLCGLTLVFACLWMKRHALV
jgi:hypothetical protein